jgi:hypothetical protein
MHSTGIGFSGEKWLYKAGRVASFRPPAARATIHFYLSIAMKVLSSLASAITTLLLREDLRENFRKRLADQRYEERNITRELQYLLAYC